MCEEGTPVAQAAAQAPETNETTTEGKTVAAAMMEQENDAAAKENVISEAKIKHKHARQAKAETPPDTIPTVPCIKQKLN